MMFLWIPFLFLIGFAVLRASRPGDAGMGCCGMSHATGPHVTGAQTPGTSDPVEIVRARLARGEITPEEYDLIRRTLG